MVKSQLIGVIIAPLTQLLGLLEAPVRDLVGLIDARIEQLGEGTSAGAEAPLVEVATEPVDEADVEAEAEPAVADAGSETAGDEPAATDER